MDKMIHRKTIHVSRNSEFRFQNKQIPQNLFRSLSPDRKPVRPHFPKPVRLQQSYSSHLPSDPLPKNPPNPASDQSSKILSINKLLSEVSKPSDPRVKHSSQSLSRKKTSKDYSIYKKFDSNEVLTIYGIKKRKQVSTDLTRRKMLNAKDNENFQDFIEKIKNKSKDLRTKVQKSLKSNAYEIKASLCISLQMGEFGTFSNRLKETSVSLYELKDPSNFNIFHDLAGCSIKEENVLKFLQCLISEFGKRYQQDSSFYVEQMLNMPGGKEKITPLTVAVKNNRKELCKALISLGANPSIKAENSENLSSVAAKYGSEYVLAYLCREIGVNCWETDRFKRNALHAAVAANQTNTGLMLIAWCADLNVVDLEGNTALHLAVSRNNYKLVRNLVIRGRSEKIVNMDGKKPIDLAQKNSEIFKMLVKRNQKNSWLRHCNPFSEDLKESSNSYTKFLAYVLIFSLRLAITIVFSPNIYQFLFLISIGLLILTGMLFMLSSCKDPGFVKKDNNCEILKLLEVYRSEYICFYCECRKHTKTRHCHNCKRCVQEMDHHCKWLHNCVGKGNYAWFMIFIVFSLLDFGVQAFIAISDYFKLFYSEGESLIQNEVGLEGFTLFAVVVNGIGVVFISRLLILQIQKACKALKMSKDLNCSQNSFPPLELSDTGSMLLKSSEDWTINSLNQN